MTALARRLLLSTTQLELLRRSTLPSPLRLPPGFQLKRVAEPRSAEQAALAGLLRDGVARSTAAGEWTVHPAVADDLRVLAAPDMAISVRAARADLDVTGCLALSGPRGAGLLRTGDDGVQLSAFAATTLHDELARMVPVPDVTATPAASQELPLDGLLDGRAARARGPMVGSLRATVTAPAGGLRSSVLWMCDRGGWFGLEPLPSRDGRPWVRLLPVRPADLGAWVAPLLARVAA